jgi:hypothetical protein
MRGDGFVQRRTSKIESEHDLASLVLGFNKRIQRRKNANVRGFHAEENPVSWSQA